jgi:hypothetical protein
MGLKALTAARNRPTQRVPSTGGHTLADGDIKDCGEQPLRCKEMES